ncbi:hypothetical protein [Rhodococcoides fascians]|uniref:hypothetical protein n=1 Tax=Rhodococcoides fascians TaxID=1828 RepID=UPI00056754C9|nr:hypothetical protein [Rhodococcus fascians]
MNPTLIRGRFGHACEKCGAIVVGAALTPSKSAILELVAAGGNYAVDLDSAGSPVATRLTAHQSRMRNKAGLGVWSEHRTNCVGRR